MKVKKPISKGVTILISIIVDLYDDDDGTVRIIQGKLMNLKGGEKVDTASIFGKWANHEPGEEIARKIVKKVCAIIKDEMFE